MTERIHRMNGAREVQFTDGREPIRGVNVSLYDGWAGITYTEGQSEHTTWIPREGIREIIEK